MRKHGNERTVPAWRYLECLIRTAIGHRPSHLLRLQQTIARLHQDERKGSDLSYLGPVVAHFRISSLHCPVTVARVRTRALPTHAFPYNGKMPASNNPAATNHQLCILPSTAKRTTTGQRGAAGYLRALRRHLRIMEFANAGGGCHRRGRDALP